MSNRLITTSLLDSIKWAQGAPASQCKDNPETTWREKAYKDLKNTLGRVAWEPDPWIKRGIDFEQSVYRHTEAHTDPEEVKASENFKVFLREAKGAITYRKSKSFLQLDGEEYCLFGKLDLFWPKLEVFPGKIKDIKTTKKYGGKSKYLDTCQHKIYCLNEKIEDFEYLIGEFSDTDLTDMTVKAIYRVPYHVDSFSVIKEEIEQRVKDAVDFLKMFDEPGDLWDLYLNKFCYKY